MDEVRYSKVVGEFELKVVKWSERFDDAFAFAWAAVGLGMLALSNGWIGWGPDATQSRWLIRLSVPREPGEDRIVQTAFTLWGARRGARRVYKILVAGDDQAIQALPDMFVH